MQGSVSFSLFFCFFIMIGRMTKKKQEIPKEKVKTVCATLDRYQHFLCANFNLTMNKGFNSEFIKDEDIAYALNYSIRKSKEDAFIFSIYKDVPMASTKEAGTILSLDPKTIVRQIESGKIKGKKVGKNYKIEAGYLYQKVFNEYTEHYNAMLGLPNEIGSLYLLWELETVKKLKLNNEKVSTREFFNKLSKARFDIKVVTDMMTKAQLKRLNLNNEHIKLLEDYHFSRRLLNNLYDYIYNKVGSIPSFKFEFM